MNVLVKAFLLRRAQLRRKVDAEAEAVAEQLTNEGLVNRASTFLGRDRLELTPRGRRELSKLETDDPAAREVIGGAVDPLRYSEFLRISGSEGLFGFLQRQQRLNQVSLIHLFWPQRRLR